MGEILIAPKLQVGAPADHKGGKPESRRPCAMDTAPPVDINELVKSNPIHSCGNGATDFMIGFNSKSLLIKI
jgi:hypothetical protein